MFEEGSKYYIQSQQAAQDHQEGEKSEIQKLFISQLQIIEDQIYPPYSEEELAVLASNIKENGVLTPLVVREEKYFDDKGRHKVKYTVLSGRNRTAAAKLAGLTELPCRVVVCTDDEAERIVLDSNFLQRKKVPLSATIRAYSRRYEVEKALKRGISNDEEMIYQSLYESLGISRGKLFNYIRYANKLEPSLFPLLDTKELTLAGANVLVKFDFTQQKKISESIDLAVPNLKRMFSEYSKADNDPANASQSRNQMLEDILNRISEEEKKEEESLPLKSFKINSKDKDLLISALKGDTLSDKQLKKAETLIAALEKMTF